jgi:hypothetical protein
MSTFLATIPDAQFLMTELNSLMAGPSFAEPRLMRSRQGDPKRNHV